MNRVFKSTGPKAGPFCIIGLLAAASILCTGCPIALDPAATDPADDTAPNETPDPPQQFITVQFRNLTPTNAVDVGFYVALEPIESIPDDLFQEALRVRAEIGVAGTGILEPLSEDMIRLDCGPDLTLGTTGGLFLDNDSGAELGVGTPRWAQEAALGLCGNTIVFDFVTVDNGFDTIVRIGD